MQTRVARLAETVWRAAGEDVDRDRQGERRSSMAADVPKMEDDTPEPAGRELGGARGVTWETEGWAAPLTDEEADAFLGIDPRLA